MTEITIAPAFTMDARGRDRRDGFDVFVGKEWHERYSTKRQALAAKAELEANAEASDEVADEALEEIWVMGGGAAKATAEHEVQARASLAELEAAGWTVLSAELKREAFCYVATLEAVIRKADRVALIRWNTFNRGWMEQDRYGATIFNADRAAA